MLCGAQSPGLEVIWRKLAEKSVPSSSKVVVNLILPVNLMESGAKMLSFRRPLLQLAGRMSS
jgi:hypothetical protein